MTVMGSSAKSSRQAAPTSRAKQRRFGVESVGEGWTWIYMRGHRIENAGCISTCAQDVESGMEDQALSNVRLLLFFVISSIISYGGPAPL